MSRLILAILAASSVVSGCATPPKAQSASGERLPPDGTPGGPGLTALESKSLDREEWARVTTDRLKPACDARPGSRRTDIPNLESAGKILETWADFTKNAKGGGSRTSGEKQVGRSNEPTRYVASVGLTCSAQRNAIQVNGVEHPFDIAWVVSGKGTAPTLSGEPGAGYFAMIEALSFADKKLIFAKVYVPSDANDDTDNTVVIADLAGYLPENPDEPIVRTIDDRDNPKLETFVFTKGAAEGISLLVPRQGAGRKRSVSIARFVVQ